MRKTVLLAIFFVFYAVVLTGGLLVVRFPKGLFLSAAEARLENAFPGSTWSLGDVSLRAPFGLVLRGVRVGHDALGKPVLIEEVPLEIDRSHPLSGFSTSFSVLGAEVAGDVRYDSEQQILSLPAVTIRGVDLAGLTGLADAMERQVGGSAAFTGSYRKSLQEGGDMVVRGTLRIDDLQLPLKRPILREENLQFATLTVEIEAAGSLVSLAQGRATGSSYLGTFNGEVRLNKPWQESEIAVFGAFQAQPEYVSRQRHLARSIALLNKTYGAGPIPCTIRGNLTAPIFAFGRGQRP